MKKNVLWSVTLLIIGTFILSCSDQIDNPGPKTDDGEDTRFKISLQLPPGSNTAVQGWAFAAPETRADHPATNVESILEKIHIFVFNADGSLPSDRSKGVIGPLDLTTDFTSLGNVHTSNDELVTTTGVGKKIYVIGNLDKSGIDPTNPATIYNEESLINKALAVRANLVHYNAGTSPSSMLFTGSATQDLNVTNDGSPVSINVAIGRAVSRVITTSQPKHEKDWGTTKAEINMSHYWVTQDAHSSYIAEGYFSGTSRVRTAIASVPDKSNWGSILNLYKPSDYASSNPPYLTITEDEATEAQRANLPRFYIGENASNYPGTTPVVAKQGNTTYAWIKTILDIDATAEVSSTGTIEYTGPGINAGDPPANRTFYLIRVSDECDHICKDETTANAVVEQLKLDYPASEVKSYVFAHGYMYYRAFLNQKVQDGNGNDVMTPENKYNVYRNQFIHMDVKDINFTYGVPGGAGKIYPGDPTNPDVPIDPIAEPEDPNNPNGGGDTPDKPIDEEEVGIVVNITVKQWEYMPNGIVL